MTRSNGKPIVSEETRQRLRQRAKEQWARKRAERSSQSPLQPQPDPEPEPVLAQPKQQSRATLARWAGEQATEQDLRQYFEQIPVDKGFLLYARMRANLEIAGKILNERYNVPEREFCKTCGISKESFLARTRRNDWYLNRAHYKDGDRNIIESDHFCSAACLSLENNKTQGTYGVSDQGMTPDMNPRNHPREFDPGHGMGQPLPMAKAAKERRA